jgi:PKD repeat protein
MILAALALGCAAGPYGAPDGSTIVLRSDLADNGYIFDLSYNDPDDGIGLLVKESLVVYSPEDLPMNDILVEVTSGWSAAYVIPVTAVKTVDQYQSECEGDASEECRAWFDIGTDSYVEFAGDYEDLGGLKPNYMSGSTDNRGVLDFYTFVDSIPVDDEGEVLAVPFYASIGVYVASWQYDFE